MRSFGMERRQQLRICQLTERADRDTSSMASWVIVVCSTFHLLHLLRWSKCRGWL